VEEFFLHLWDELDDLAGVCRHVTSTIAAEVVAVSAPAIAAAAASVLAGAATLMLSHRHLLNILA
jgi:hypothetical protein